MGLEEGDVSLAEVKAQRREEGTCRGNVGAEIEFFDAGDYPLHDARDARPLVNIYRELKPSFVLTHSLEDPYNVDHPEHARFAQEARIIAQAAATSRAPTSPTMRPSSCSSRTSPSSATTSRQT